MEYYGVVYGVVAQAVAKISQRGVRMAVFRRYYKGKESDTYYCKFRVDGQQVMKNTGCRSERAAKAWEREYVENLRTQANAEAVAERIRQIKSGGRPIALAEGAELYLAKPLARSPGNKRQVQIVNVWLDFVKFATERGQTTFAAVTARTAEAYAKTLQDSNRSVKTCNEYAGICRQIFKALKREAGLHENPFGGVPRFRGPGKKRHAFSRDELGRLLENCDAETRPLIVVAACTGLRLVDAVALEWRQVDLANGWIVRTMSKTGEQVRCPIMPRLRQELEAMDQSGDLIFPRFAEIHRRRPSTLSDGFSAAIAAAGLNKSDDLIRDFHSIRHAFVWMAAESGVPMSVVQKMAGHLTPAMTRLYADHATAEAMTRAAASIGDPFVANHPKSPLQAFTTAELQAEIDRRLGN